MGNYREMPADFADHAGEGFEALMKRYRAGAEVIRRWKQLSGTLRPWGNVVVRTDEHGNERRFENVKTASHDSYVSTTAIYKAIRERRKACGYKWRYEV